MTRDSHGPGNVRGDYKDAPIRCAGCSHEFEVGDRYIEDTSSGFTNNEADPVVDGFIAEIFGGANGKVRFCEDCTEPGGDYLWETFYGDEVAS